MSTFAEMDPAIAAQGQGSGSGKARLLRESSQIAAQQVSPVRPAGGRSGGSYQERWGFSIAEAVAYCGICRTTLYALFRARSIDVRKAGAKTIVSRASLDRYLDTLPAAYR